MNPMDLAMRLLKQDLPDWTKDLFDSKGNLKNYSPSLDEEPKEIPTPPLHPGRTRLDINEHGKQFYPSQYSQQVNLPYGYEREMSIDEVIDSHGVLRNMPREAAEEYVKQHPFEAFRHLNTKDSRKSPFQLNLQRLTEFEDYDGWDESDKNDDITSQDLLVVNQWTSLSAFSKTASPLKRFDTRRNTTQNIRRHPSVESTNVNCIESVASVECMVINLERTSATQRAENSL